MTDYSAGANSGDTKKMLDRAIKLVNQKSTKSIEEAFKILSECCNKDANMAKAFLYRGMCYNLLGDFQRALYDFSVCIRIQKDSKDFNQKDLAEAYNHAGV